jgi:hypothetical protein
LQRSLYYNIFPSLFLYLRKLQKQQPASCTFTKDPEAKMFFSKVDFDFLLEGATILNPLSDGGASEFNNFMAKPRKDF